MDRIAQPIIHATVPQNTYEKILLLAESENRSKSNMIATLIDEALTAREKKITAGIDKNRQSL